MSPANFLFDCTLIALVACTACGTTSGSAPPPAPRDSAAVTATEKVRSGYTAADVHFMQGMIEHHAQALAMSALIAGRTNREDFKALGERIRISQESEIARMENWLRKRGENVRAMAHVEHMPGMLSAEEMAQLGKTSGVEFERLFLQSMIKHHEGALTMVRQLFATPGAASDPDIYILANDIDADQNAELRRMRALLGR